MKKIILVLMLVFLTGCTAKYNLEVTKDGVRETGIAMFNISELDGASTEDKLNELVGKYFGNSDILIAQNMEYIRDTYNKGYKVENFHDYGKLEEMPYLTYCYEDVKITDTEDLIKFETVGEFKCYEYYDELEFVMVSVKSDLKNISHNADFVKDDTYVWYIEKDDIEKTKISFEFKKNDKKLSGYDILFIIIGVVGGITIILYIFFVIKNESSNNI